MDDADISAPRIEAAVASGVERSRQALARRVIEPTGRCHWCERDFPETLVVDEDGERLVMSEKLFCDKECAAGWEHERQRKRDLGR